MGYTPDVLVIGGGATGTGVARDLALRGLEVTLVDRGTLASGTSGSMHALLHSGARYADDDPALAATCHRENRILRTIGPHLVTETGGLFASLPDDGAASVERKIAACEDAGIDTELLSGEVARQREPALSPAIERAVTVPDAVVDPFALCAANALDARRHGATIRTGTRVEAIERDGGAIEEVRLAEAAPDAEWATAATPEWLSPDYVVNATGPRAAAVAAMADLEVSSRFSQGAMLVVDRAGLETVVNRCRPRTEGDIAVPFGPAAVLGTTDRPIDGPDAVERDPAEVDLLVDELSALVPDVAGARPFRAYWGVRALPADGGDGSAGRAATVVDHEAAAGVWGMTSVFGGKLTTHRDTAERVADHVCAAFGIDRPCLTADRDLPAVPPAGDSPADHADDPPLCQAGRVRRSAVRTVLEEETVSLGSDLRPVAQLTRAGWGACQGGRCAHRLAAEVDRAGAFQVVDRALRDFADERWAGRRHALWGENFAAAAETDDFHRRTLHRDGRPTDGGSPLEWSAYDDGRVEDTGGPERV